MNSNERTTLGAHALRATAVAASGALALALLAPGRAEATTTRVWTLGGMNRFVMDDANRWLYPHTITKYGNLFYLELYGAKDSYDFTAPGSLRARDTSADALGFIRPIQTLSDADFVPVQASAGGGAILALTEDLSISFHLSDYENPIIRSFLTSLGGKQIVAGDPTAFPWLSSGRNTNLVGNANRKFDVFTAFDVSDMLSLGLQLSWGSTAYSRTPNANDPDVLSGDDSLKRASDSLGVSEFRFLLSTGLELSDALAIDVGFGMGFHGLTYNPNLRSDLIEGGGGLDLQADVRAIIGLTEWWELIPSLSLRTVNLSLADLANFETGLTFNKTDDTAGRQTSNITDVKSSALLFDMGVAGHFKPSDKVQFWGALGMQIQRRAFQYDHFNQESDQFQRNDPTNPIDFARDSQTTLVLPYMRLALEAKLFSWLDFRGGVVKYVRGSTVREEKQDFQSAANNRDNDFSDSEPFFDYFVGVAAHHEGFFADLQLDPVWFKRGPNFLSGAGANMFINGSIGYRF